MSRLISISGFCQSDLTLEPLVTSLPGLQPGNCFSVYSLLERAVELGVDLKEQRAAGISVYAKVLADSLAEPEPSVLIGCSTGGLVALEVAYYFPEKVDKLVLIASTASYIERGSAENNLDCCPGVPYKELRALRMAFKRNRTEAMRSFLGRMFSQGHSEISVEEKLASSTQLDLSFLLHTLDYLATSDLRPLLAGISQKTLVLHGLADKIVPFAASEFLHKHLANSELQLIADAGHAICEERFEDIAVYISRQFDFRVKGPEI